MRLPEVRDAENMRFDNSSLDHPRQPVHTRITLFLSGDEEEHDEFNDSGFWSDRLSLEREDNSSVSDLLAKFT